MINQSVEQRIILGSSLFDGLISVGSQNNPLRVKKRRSLYIKLNFTWRDCRPIDHLYSTNLWC